MADDLDKRLKKVARSCTGAQVRILGRVISSHYEAVLRPHGLTVAQMNLLVALGVRPQVRAQDLGAALFLEKSTVSRNLERMIAREWVLEGEGDDLRSRSLSLGPAGRELLETILPEWEEAQRKVRALIGAEGPEQIAAMVERLRRNER